MSFIQMIFGLTFQLGYMARDGISMDLPLTQVGILALNPRQNPVHPPLHLYQIMDPIHRHYLNHWFSPPLCYQNLLVFFVVGYSTALFSPNLDFLVSEVPHLREYCKWCLWYLQFLPETLQKLHSN